MKQEKKNSAFEITPNNPIVLGIVLIAIVGAIFLVELTKNNSAGIPLETIAVDKTGLQAAPDLQGITGYINSEPGLSLKDLRGKVVLVDFWTYSCINCIRTIPYLNDWHAKYANDGLVIIGVHAPEFEFEKDHGNVRTAVEKYGIQYPVVQDNDFTTWRAYENRFWPHKFLIDSEGYIRYDHIGEGSYAETEEKIVELLKEKNANAKLENSSNPIVDDMNFDGIGTPEIYLGAAFARAPLGNDEDFSLDAPFEYTLPDTFTANLPYFGGTWQTFDDYSKLFSESGEVALYYKAKNLNIVAGSLQGSLIKVFLNGKPLTEENAGEDAMLVEGEWVTPITDRKLYNLVSAKDYDPKSIVFLVEGKGFELYPFTFG